MKDFTLKEFGKFIEIADSIESPFKFYELSGSFPLTVRAELWLRSALISYEGEATENVIALLQNHSFGEAKLNETRKLWGDSL